VVREAAAGGVFGDGVGAVSYGPLSLFPATTARSRAVDAELTDDGPYQITPVTVAASRAAASLMPSPRMV